MSKSSATVLPLPEVQRGRGARSTGFPRLHPDFDLRIKRDLSSRRLSREWARRICRTLVLAVGDAVAIAVALRILLALPVAPVDHHWLMLLPRVVLLGLLGQGAANTFGPGRLNGDFGRVIKGAVMAQLALAVLDVIYGHVGFSARAHLALTALICTTECAWRGLIVLMLRRVYARGIGRKRTLLVANQQDAIDVLEHFRSANDPRIEVMGYVAPDAVRNPEALGGLQEIDRLIEELDIHKVVISAHLPRKELRRVIRECFLHGAAVSMVPGTLAEIPSRVSSRDVLGWPLIELEAPRLHLVQVALKRTIDVLLASALLLLVAPLLIAVAVAIRVESPGPIFFSQRRPGLGGRLFAMLKFRTMRADAEEVLRANPVLHERFVRNDCKLPPNEDPRILRVGRFLRATSIDELPQLFNVLRGDMSLIGPRPVVGPELAHYGEWMSVVLGVRPGMTGYWQVAGRSAIAYPERAHMDIFYVTRWSLGLDLKILALTVPAVLRRSGAF